MKNIQDRFFIKVVNLVSIFIIFVTNILAQMPTRPVEELPAPIEDDSTMYYIVLFILVAGLAGAIGWLYYSKKVKKSDKGLKDDDWDSDSVDADKELEWLRKHTKQVGKKGASKNNYPKGFPRTSNILNKNKAETLQGNGMDFDYIETQKKLKKIKFEKLPITSFSELKPAKQFDALPISNDEALMNAIEQTQDEFEEDVEIRELAVRILARFRTRNSIEALTDVALYDLSSHLRSKAVMVLAEFDHESVFETILLGCADPTREVRAASAKALFQLSFDRSDAWTRIALSGDEFRVSQAAKAAIESDLVDRSIDRLVHEDHKYAYEAFTLLALLVKAGETKEIFQALENHRDTTVKIAVLKVLKVLRDDRVLPGIYSFIERNSLPEDLSNAANEVIKSCELVPA